MRDLKYFVIGRSADLILLAGKDADCYDCELYLPPRNQDRSHGRAAA